jgi:phenylalanyl-tRNA synthetase beta chain
MKITLNWLKQYVDFNWPPEELTERLTMLGLEVEGVQKLGGEFEGIVVAQVITRDKHPNADKLSLCRVNDGQGERQIVCGAQNFQAGDKVPLILPGASLPPKPGEKEAFTIKVGKIRGVESHGMMCSPQELGLPDQVDGLLILRADARVGQPFAEYLGRTGSDVVYDLEVTPNRPDLNSAIGIAREIAALTGNPLKLPDVPVVSGPMSMAGADPNERIDRWVEVRVAEPELCPRYTARVVQSVTVGPSPDWLKHTLEELGIRSINNVVDVTNYVMMETGQPLHAFDYHLLAPGAAGGRPTIVVRRAAASEKFTTLDGQDRTLASDMLLIADETKGIALAGIMGGQNTEIKETTRDVLIESAYFKPQNIRRTSKALGLRSESSYRFERGADISMADWASRRAVQLILETAGGSLVPGVVDACAHEVKSKEITLRYHRTNELLGIEVSAETQDKFLQRLGLELVEGRANASPVPSENSGDAPEQVPPNATYRIPTWRVDLKRETDLIEEVCRLYGIDKIPSAPPRGAIGSNSHDAVHDQIGEARRILTGLGLNETQGQTLISDASAKLLILSAAAPSIVELANPLSSDMNVLRPSLIPGLLDALRHNLHHKTGDVAVFEIGRVFTQERGQTKEERRVAIALTGLRQPTYWIGDNRDARFDIFDLKGLLEEFLEQFGLRGVTWTRRAESASFYLESAHVQLGGKLPLGELGQLSPLLAKQYDLRDAVLLAELNLDILLARRNPGKTFKPLPLFPSIRRDIAMLVPESTTHETVLSAVRQAKPQNLEGVELFDVFRGQNIPEGRKSLAYAFTYRATDKTLTDAEVNAAHAKVVEAFKAQLQATVRE